MKHIRIYEAFESGILQKVIQFLSKKIDKNESNRFVKDLKKLIKIFDIPIDKIQDYNIKYLNRNKGIEDSIKCIAVNSSGIYCIKYWFSLGKGYIGSTVTGASLNIKHTSIFSKTEIDYIKNIINIDIENLYPVSDYKSLRTNDEVIGYFTSNPDIGVSYALSNGLQKAKIFIDDDKIYAIQELSNGSSPNNKDWKLMGKFSWIIAENNKPKEDHSKLNKILYHNPYDNLSTDNELSVDLNKTILMTEEIKKCDFCIIFYLDDMLNPDKSLYYESPSELRRARAFDKNNALKLNNNDTIRNMNIEKYIKMAINNMNVDNPDKINNLQNIFSSYLCGNFSFISLYNKGISDLMDTFIYIINNLEDYIEDEKIESIKKLSIIYSKIWNNSIYLKNKYLKTQNSLFNCEDTEDNKKVKEIIKIVNKISVIINNYIKSNKIQSINSMIILYYKLRSISEIIDRNRLTPTLDNLILIYENELVFTRRVMNLDYKPTYFEKDIKILKLIESYINSILK